MEMEEVVKLLIAVVVLVIMVGAIVFLFTEKGVQLLDSIKNTLRFGGK